MGTLQAFDGSEGNSKGLVVNVLCCLILNYMIVILSFSYVLNLLHN